MTPSATLGLIGGGQLGRMLIQEASALGIAVNVLDPDRQCPAAPFAARLITACFDDAKAMMVLADGCDAVTLEIEAPPAAMLAQLEAQGVHFFPGSAVLAILQDKFFQRRFFKAHGLPQPRFQSVDGSIRHALAAFGEPCVIKSRRNGFDGRGVLIPGEQTDSALDTWNVPSLLESRVRLAKELAVIVVRGSNGNSVVYDPVELIMDPVLNLLDCLVAPARVPPYLAAQAMALAKRAVQALGGIGTFGVEIFLDQTGQLLINEVSPRVHNSGHHSLEACETSQFTNHWLAILGLPLGPGTLRQPASVANLLGPQNLRGAYRVEGLANASAMPGVFVHLYGKDLIRPGRKMGHITALAESADQALALAKEARRTINFLEES